MIQTLSLTALAALPGVRITREDAANGLAAYEHNREASSAQGGAPPLCSIDLRDRMPACKQQGAEWCWATGVAEFSFYYNKSSTAAGDTCSSTECSVVSLDLHTECCPYSQHKGCGSDGESVKDIVTTASRYIGRDFRSLGRAPTEAQLASHLMAGRPLMPIIMWETGGGHALMVAGCNSSTSGWRENKYFLHDPERNYYEEVGYMRLLDYSMLHPGKWVDTVLVDE